MRRAVFLSSRAVYGPHPAGVWLDEAEVAHPDTLYGEVKLAAEQALAKLRNAAFDGVSLRVTGVYGPAGPGELHKWAQLFSAYLAGRTVAPRIATEVHGVDVGEAVRLMLDMPDHLPECLNVSDITVDRHDLLAIVQRATGCPHPLPPRGNAVGLNPMHTGRLRALGWQPGGNALLERTVMEFFRHG